MLPVLLITVIATALGATPMDRPEWTAVDPWGNVYCTLTNNGARTVPDAANPMAPNPDGHIIKWRDADNHVGTTFEWDIFLLAGQGRGVPPKELYKPLADSWPTYSGDYTGRRFSALTNINRLTVKNLSLAWVSSVTPAAIPVGSVI